MSDRRPDALTPAVLRDWGLPSAAGSKYDRGSVLVVGGASGTPGAAMLTGVAALRAGAGRLTLAVAEDVAPAVAVAVPESGVVPLRRTASGSVRGEVTDRLAHELASADVVVVGPGLDDAPQARELLLALVPHVAAEAVVVLDAFALGVLPDVEAHLTPLHGRLVLTPNTTEATLLLEASPEDDADVDSQTLEIASRYRAVVTCQGYVGTPEGSLWQNATGTSGLATSGSGDVLAGAVAGIAARSVEPERAACWGTYLHAVAGDRLAASVGAVGYLARELCDQLPHVLDELST